MLRVLRPASCSEWDDGIPPPQHRPHCERRRAVHRLLWSAKLHRRPHRFYHRAVADPDRPHQGWPAWGTGGNERQRPDHRNVTESQGLCDRPVRQEPSGRQWSKSGIFACFTEWKSIARIGEGMRSVAAIARVRATPVSRALPSSLTPVSRRLTSPTTLISRTPPSPVTPISRAPPFLVAPNSRALPYSATPIFEAPPSAISCSTSAAPSPRNSHCSGVNRKADSKSH